MPTIFPFSVKNYRFPQRNSGRVKNGEFSDRRLNLHSIINEFITHSVENEKEGRDKLFLNQLKDEIWMIIPFPLGLGQNQTLSTKR
ncbi:MAG: hypothetical protein C0433_02495 [Cyclobacterium sp.]|nr:hypothetical protein [Cyclobacterium sp.]